jgi:hypothetical protein
MNKKGLYITLAVAVVIAAVAYIAGSVNKNNDEVSAKKTVTNQTTSAFVVNPTSDGLAFTSALFNFSFTTGSEYGYLENSTASTELASYVLNRENENTSEQPNRDTPNGFNTSVDDRIGVTVFQNNQHITLDNLAEFISWQELVTPSADINGSATTHVFTLNNAIEAITAGGIDDFSRCIYFINDSYIVEIGSADVSKDELYDIANTFEWL